MPRCVRCDSGLVFYGVYGGSLEDCSAGDGTGVGGGVYYARRDGGS